MQILVTMKDAFIGTIKYIFVDTLRDTFRNTFNLGGRTNLEGFLSFEGFYFIGLFCFGWINLHNENILLLY